MCTIVELAYTLPPGNSEYDASVLKIAWSGHVCVDVSKLGAKAGKFGPQSKLLLVWMGERRILQEPILFMECTELWDPVLVVEFLGDLYTLHVILLGPEDLGVWATRVRKFAILVLNSFGVLGRPMELLRSMFTRRRPSFSKQGDMFFVRPRPIRTRCSPRLRQRGL